ncbi:MAG: ribonuclease III [Bacilli bacterium]|nr:ribonuclease III [Bacilli bacterium]
MIDYNVLTLAYIGDAIYEVYIREFLIKKGFMKVNKLQQEAINYVSATSQRQKLEKLINNNILNEEELNVMNRARNHKGTRHPKNTDIITYKYATAFEAIIGYLYLKQDKNRLDEIINYIVKE